MIKIPTHKPGACWWCGAKADSYEHKFKKSDLKRAAGAEGPQGLYKSSRTYKGTLKSLNKGAQVRWEKNLCRACNNEKSQPFDRAYDEFVDYYLTHFNTMQRQPGIDWSDIYHSEWRQKSANLSRYLIKQFGCMLASGGYAVPEVARDFLNGNPIPDSLVTQVFRNWRAIRLHKTMMTDDPTSDGMKSYLGLPSSPYFADEEGLSGAVYILDIGYLKFTAEWMKHEVGRAMHEVPRIRMPLLHGDRASRREWYRIERQGNDQPN